MADMRTPLNRVRGLGSAHEGADHFWRQRLTAVANAPLVLFLVATVVYLAGADHAQAAAYLGSPPVAVLLAALVVSATLHMRLGMQAIIEDYVHGELAKIALLAVNTFFTILLALACMLAIIKLALGG